MGNLKLISTRKKCLACDTHNRFCGAKVPLGGACDCWVLERSRVRKMRMSFNHDNILNDNDSHLQELIETKCKRKTNSVREKYSRAED
jgi:hypothetical protein